MDQRSIVLFIMCLILLSSCGNEASMVIPTVQQEDRSLTVLAASSLTSSFKEIATAFVSQNPGVTVALNFGGSQTLAEQIDQGAPADVFASASLKVMDAVIASDRVEKGTPVVFVKNKLVVILPISNVAVINSIGDLTKNGVKIIMADKAVPVGQYALEFLDKASTESTLGPGFKEAVLSNVVSYETDVRTVVSKVSLGEADAGIVYLTDQSVAPGKLRAIEIPDTINISASYPIATISDSNQADLAKAFVAFVTSPAGQAILAKYGFIPVLK